MKLKKFNEKYEKKVKKIDKKKRKFVDINWVIKITVCAFLLSLIFSLITDKLVPSVNAIVGVALILIIIIIGVIFDMIGVSVTACDIKPFNSMASKRVKGSKTAIWLIKNAEKVASFCNDVIGDVCGIISGSLGVLISVIISAEFNFDISIVTLLLTSIIAALTIGGKALGKSYAINKSDVIVFKFAKFIRLFRREKR